MTLSGQGSGAASGGPSCLPSAGEFAPSGGRRAV